MKEPRVHVVHATAPGCHWSWGYEAVVNRIRMVYGDQVALHLRVGCPYDDKAQWLADYGMTAQEAEAWLNDEAAPAMDVPLARVSWSAQPQTLLPASLAALAALRQGEEKGWRFHRALLRMYAAEGRDPSAPESIEAAAVEAGIDIRKVQAAFRDEEQLLQALGEQDGKGPPVPVGFYNLVVTDGANRRVILDYAFEPRDVEEAIDYIAGGSLTKARPDAKDVPRYLREHGPAPLSELRRVFGLAAEEAPAVVEAHEKSGRIERVVLAGAPHWRVAP